MAKKDDSAKSKNTQNPKDYKSINERIEQGLKPEEKTGKLRNEVITANLGLIKDVLKKMNISSLQYDDLSSEGMMAISDAFDKYIPGKGAKFSTVAEHYIENRIRNELKKTQRQNPGKEIYGNPDDSDSDTIDNLALEIHSDSPQYFATFDSDPEKQFEREEKRKEELQATKKLLLKHKVSERDCNIFLEYMGLNDGIQKNHNELRKIFNIKSSELQAITRTCQRIYNNEKASEKNKNAERNYAYIQEKDIALMNFILDQNRLIGDPLQFPNRQDILKSELSEYFHSVDSVSDSVSRLRDIKGCIFKKKGQKQGFYITNPEVVDGRLNLSNDELFSISTISILLNQYKNTPLEKTFKTVWEKVTENLQGVISNDSVFQKNKVSMITDPLPKLDENVFNKIIKACRSNNTVQFVYHSQGRAAIDERRADPYRIICQKGSWYMLAFCHVHNEFRWFSFSRVKKIKILDEKFEPKKDFNLKKFFSPESGILWKGELTHIKLEFPKKIALYISERKWYENQKITINEDGSVILEFNTDNEMQLISFVMQFHEDVKVLEPESLRQKIKATAKKIAGYY